MVVSQQRVFAPRLLFKITLPYVALALVLALATIYVIASARAGDVTAEFSRQLDESRLRVADSVVRTEQSQLTNVRLLSRVAGLAGAVRAGNAARLIELTRPFAASQRIERIVVVDARGQPVVALHGRGPDVMSVPPNPAAASWAAAGRSSWAATTRRWRSSRSPRLWKRAPRSRSRRSWHGNDRARARARARTTILGRARASSHEA